MGIVHSHRSPYHLQAGCQVRFHFVRLVWRFLNAARIAAIGVAFAPTNAELASLARDENGEKKVHVDTSFAHLAKSYTYISVLMMRNGSKSGIMVPLMCEFFFSFSLSSKGFLNPVTKGSQH